MSLPSQQQQQQQNSQKLTGTELFNRSQGCIAAGIPISRHHNEVGIEDIQDDQIGDLGGFDKQECHLDEKQGYPQLCSTIAVLVQGMIKQDKERREEDQRYQPEIVVFTGDACIVPLIKAILAFPTQRIGFSIFAVGGTPSVLAVTGGTTKS